MAVALGPGSEGWSLEGWGLEGWNRVLLGWQAEDGALGLLAAGVI